MNPFTRLQVAVLGAAAIMLAACGDTNVTMPPFGMSTAAYQHLDNIIDIMQANSVKRRVIN